MGRLKDPRLAPAFAGSEGAPGPRELIRALSDPSLYPGGPEQVEVRETHASAVFLTPTEAYKLKKPVDFGFLDYSTPAKRRRMCHREVELNRRLAPDVYLGVVPVTSADGRVRLGGRGTVVDYLVHMRRLPDETMLRSLVERDAAGEVEIRAVARKLAAFHRDAARGPQIDRLGLPRAIARNTEENFSQTATFLGQALDASAFDEIVRFTRRFLRGERKLLLDRVTAGRIRDGHGDLRADHVYIDSGIRIIDCIEFNTRFRYADVVADLAFLAMDLDALGAPDLASSLVDEYGRASGADPAPVLDFYRCYRAYTRGKVACLRTAEPGLDPAASAQALNEARRQFRLALRYARGECRPWLVLVTGLPATGKSTLARGLQNVLPGRVVSADQTRKQLAGVCRETRLQEPLDAGLYSAEMNAWVYAELLAEAERDLARGRSVILDATYRRRVDREAALALAQRHGARFLAIECLLGEETVRRRIDARALEGADWSDATWEVYLHQRSQWETLDELPADERLCVDTGQPVAAQVDVVLKRLAERERP